MRLLIPVGWVDQNKALYARLMREGYASIDPVNQLVNSRAFGEWSGGIDAKLASAFQPYAVFSRIAIPNYSKAGRALARNQTHIHLAFLACALERHRAAKSAYPDTLAALVPEFATKLPHDVIDGQPLRYRRTDDGKYLLYSLGWNAQDDGGAVKLGKNNQPDWDTSPDWVWNGVPKK